MGTKIQKIIEKRRRISKKDALEVLNDNFQELFVAYNDGLEHYNVVIQELRPEVRVRIDSGILKLVLLRALWSISPTSGR